MKTLVLAKDIQEDIKEITNKKLIQRGYIVAISHVKRPGDLYRGEGLFVTGIKMPGEPFVDLEKRMRTFNTLQSTFKKSTPVEFIPFMGTNTTLYEGKEILEYQGQFLHEHGYGCY